MNGSFACFRYMFHVFIIAPEQYTVPMFNISLHDDRYLKQWNTVNLFHEKQVASEEEQPFCQTSLNL